MNKKTYITYLMLTFFVNSYGMNPVNDQLKTRNEALPPLKDGYTRIGLVQIPDCFMYDVIVGNLFYNPATKQILLKEPIQNHPKSCIPAPVFSSLKGRQEFLENLNASAIYK